MSAARPFQDKPALRVDGLSIARGGRVLFKDMSFEASAGEYVELRGANGAGKTSLLRALAGFLKPRAGRIEFDGEEEPGLALHFIGHTNGLKPNLSARAHIMYWAGLFGAPHGWDIPLQSVGLAGMSERLTRTLSQGQARRLALTRLLVAPRKLWLLDEPAAALDDAGRAMVGELVAAHCKHGGIVVAAVHEPLGPTPSHVLTVGS